MHDDPAQVRSGKRRVGRQSEASHEICSQANTIIGFTDLLAETALDAEQRGYLDHLSAAAQKLVRFTTDLLDFAGAKGHALQVREADFDLAAAIAEAFDSMSPNAIRKGLELRYQIFEDVPRYVTADRDRLQQVLANLVRNAIKFTQEGEVTVRVKAPVHADGFCIVLFSVSDTGMGISPERRDAIFEPFEQENPLIRQRFGGNGLGLAIARHVVRRMGGRIWVESVPGEGSTFFFTVRFKYSTGPAHLAPRS